MWIPCKSVTPNSASPAWGWSSPPSGTISLDYPVPNSASPGCGLDMGSEVVVEHGLIQHLVDVSAMMAPEVGQASEWLPIAL